MQPAIRTGEERYALFYDLYLQCTSYADMLRAVGNMRKSEAISEACREVARSHDLEAARQLSLHDYPDDVAIDRNLRLNALVFHANDFMKFLQSADRSDREVEVLRTIGDVVESQELMLYPVYAQNRARSIASMVSPSARFNTVIYRASGPMGGQPLFVAYTDDPAEALLQFGLVAKGGEFSRVHGPDAWVQLTDARNRLGLSMRAGGELSAQSEEGIRRYGEAAPAIDEHVALEREVLNALSGDVASYLQSLSREKLEVVINVLHAIQPLRPENPLWLRHGIPPALNRPQWAAKASTAYMHAIELLDAMPAPEVVQELPAAAPTRLKVPVTMNLPQCDALVKVVREEVRRKERFVEEHRGGRASPELQQELAQLRDAVHTLERGVEDLTQAEFGVYRNGADQKLYRLARTASELPGYPSSDGLRYVMRRCDEGGRPVHPPIDTTIAGLDRLSFPQAEELLSNSGSIMWRRTATITIDQFRSRDGLPARPIDVRATIPGPNDFYNPSL